MTRPLLAILLLMGCAPSLTTVPAGPEFDLAPGATVVLDGAGVELTMIDVANDSRCPTDVVCVWAGDAEVRIQVRTGASDTVVTLHAMQEPKAATVGRVRLELTSLTPSNRAGTPTPPADYRARIRWSVP